MKETFYFTHDYSARSDEKIKRLLRKHNYCGYGIFWAIVEDLYNNANAMQTDYEGIAFDLHSDSETIKSIINDFDLFEVNDGFFGSLSVQRRLDERSDKSGKARVSALKRWDKNRVDANALNLDANAMLQEVNRNAKKESKGEESKVETPKYIYSKFYDEQLLLSENNSQYLFFVKFIFGENETKQKLTGVLSIRDQLSFDNFKRLLEISRENKVKLMDTVLKMENDNKYTKGKKVLYTTLNNWITGRFTK